MLPAENILISVEHDYVLKMLGGLKTAEVRRRPLRIRPGTRVWIYSKLPRGQVEVVATVDDVVAASPRKIWELYHGRIAITSTEFRAYSLTLCTIHCLTGEFARELGRCLP